ncbi:MAG TPA: hypothetical protein VF658_15645 [Pyrinomonadaceae bacterium]
MKDITVRKLNAGRRSLDFVEAHGAPFPARSRGSELIATMRTAVTTMETEGARQEAAERDRKEATDEKDAASAALLEQLRGYNRIARGMKKLTPGIANLFAMPRNNSDQALLNAARAIYAAASANPEPFTERGMPADFLTSLEAAINRFTRAIAAQDEALRRQTSATAALNTAEKQLTDAMSEFSPIVVTQFQNDPAVLAEWRSASRVERAPRRTKQPTPTEPKPPTT